jgi:hypothetical protein
MITSFERCIAALVLGVWFMNRGAAGSDLTER